MKLDEEIKVLAEAMLSLETEDECKKFLKDLCTVREISSMAQRIVVARLLREKKTFLEIFLKSTSKYSSKMIKSDVFLDFGFK
mgnify:CR=1 FL=1